MRKRSLMCLMLLAAAFMVLASAVTTRARQNIRQQPEPPATGIPIDTEICLDCDPDPCQTNPCACDPCACDPSSCGPTPTPTLNPTPTATPTPDPLPRCDFTVNQDPLVLTSIGYYILGSGYMAAVANDFSSCVFVADAAFFEYPLEGYPLYPLGLTVDVWRVYDNGGPLWGFWPPYVAFGEIVFVASNGVDTTIKDGIVILTIFDF